MSTILSKNWTLEELIQSSTADQSLMDKIPENDIDNTPSEEIKENLGRLARTVLQPISDSTGRRIHCTSGYRCEKLNKIVGGAATSDHLKGYAADINAIGLTNEQLFAHILGMEDLTYGQCILENLDGRKWVHVSYGTKKENMKTNGRDANGKVIYVHLA